MSLTTLAVQAIDGDIEIVPRLINGSEAIRASVVQNLRMFKGEWFLNLNEGVPYFQTVLVKGTPITVINSIIRDAVSNVPGVARVEVRGVSFDGPTRLLSISDLRIFTSEDLNEPVVFEDLVI